MIYQQMIRRAIDRVCRYNLAVYLPQTERIVEESKDFEEVKAKLDEASRVNQERAKFVRHAKPPRLKVMFTPPPDRRDIIAYTQWLESQGYFQVMYSNGIYSALIPLLFTTAIAYDLNDWGLTERYCFEDPKRAQMELMKWFDVGFDEDHIVTGFIASRGVKRPIQPHKKNDYERSMPYPK